MSASEPAPTAGPPPSLKAAMSAVDDARTAIVTAAAAQDPPSLEDRVANLEAGFMAAAQALWFMNTDLVDLRQQVASR